MDHIFPFSYVPKRFLALGPRFGLVLVAQVKGFGSRGSFWADFRVFEGVGDINNSISMLNYCDEPLSDLGGHVNKVLSAWTEVWSGSYRSRAKVLAPGGRSGQILQFLRFWAGLAILITR